MTTALKVWATGRALEEIAIELTGYCNLSCTMCSVWKVRKHGAPLDVVVRVLEEARRLGARRFIPCGAENFVRPDFIAVLETAESLGFTEIAVVTNGLLLTEERVERLARLKSLFLCISIDGPPAIHESLRGAGTYGKAVAALGRLRRAGIRFGISSVILRQTLAHLGKMVELAAREGAASLSLQPYQVEIGGPDADHASYCFSPQDEERVARELERLMEQARLRDVPLFTGSLLGHVPAYLCRGVRPIPEDGCFMPSRFVLVDLYGSIFPCFFMRGEPIGSIYQEPLERLWHNPVQRALNHLALDRECPGCLAACSDVETYRMLQRRKTAATAQR